MMRGQTVASVNATRGSLRPITDRPHRSWRPSERRKTRDDDCQNDGARHPNPLWPKTRHGWPSCARPVEIGAGGGPCKASGQQTARGALR